MLQPRVPDAVQRETVHRRSGTFMIRVCSAPDVARAERALNALLVARRARKSELVEKSRITLPPTCGRD